MKPHVKKRGFVALMSVIILSAMLLGLVSTANTAGFFVRFNVLNAEYKKGARGLADACANTALLTLAQNYAYATSVPMPVLLGSNSCTIGSVTDSGAPLPNSRAVLITTAANYQGAFSTVEVRATVANPAASPASAYPITINSWQETN